MGLSFAGFKMLKVLTPIGPVIENKKEVVISGTKYFISPTGNDKQDGLSADASFASIQKALNLVQPGDGIILAEGVYLQDFFTERDGSKEKPIVITGSKKAIVKGTGESVKIVEIAHDYYVLQGFTVDGLAGDSGDKKNYRDKLIYVQGKDALNGVVGMRILDMDIKNAGGECLRIKYFAQKNEVAYSNIYGCGAYDFIFNGGGKNGEGVYVGTAPEQVAKDKNPTQDVDNSNENWIHDNNINTQGNECVDIKEGSSGNLVEKNKCTGQKDRESGGFDARGSGNIFRGNESYGNSGAGIRLGGDKDDDGINNIIENNFLHDNENGGIKIVRNPQGIICGNKFENNKKADFAGEFGSENKKNKSCL